MFSGISDLLPFTASIGSCAGSVVSVEVVVVEAAESARW
jgi:hypothetical protein